MVRGFKVRQITLSIFILQRQPSIEFWSLNFGVGIPFDSSQVAQESFEGARVLEARREAKMALMEGLLEAVEELATE